MKRPFIKKVAISVLLSAAIIINPLAIKKANAFDPWGSNEKGLIILAVAAVVGLVGGIYKIHKRIKKRKLKKAEEKHKEEVERLMEERIQRAKEKKDDI